MVPDGVKAVDVLLFVVVVGLPDVDPGAVAVPGETDLLVVDPAGKPAADVFTEDDGALSSDDEHAVARRVPASANAVMELTDLVNFIFPPGKS